MRNHILSGCKGDGVPNVLSDDKVLAEGRRQNTLSAKKRQALIEDPEALGQEVYRNYLRNKKMIDLTNCPKEIVDKIMTEYKSQDAYSKRSKVFSLFCGKTLHKPIRKNSRVFINENTYYGTTR